MTTTKACKDVVDSMSQYMDTLKALVYIQDYSKSNGFYLDDFAQEHIPKFILTIAVGRDEFQFLDDGKFNLLLKDLMYLSNGLERKSVVSNSTDPGLFNT